MATRENWKIQSSEKFMNSQGNFITSFISLVLSNVANELQDLFSTLGIARNVFFGKDI